MVSRDEQVPVSDFYTFITPYVPNAPDEVIDHAIREAIIWFCRESRVLEDHVILRLQRGVTDYLIQLPDDRQLIALDWTREFLRKLMMGPWVNITEHFVWDIFGVGRFHPTWRKDGAHPVVEFPYRPRRDYRKELWYSWVPARDFCRVPRLLYEDYMEPIRSKALWFLYSMPATEWFDVRMAALEEISAERQLEKARARRFSNYTQGSRRMRGSPFVRRGSGLYGGPYGGGMN